MVVAYKRDEIVYMGAGPQFICASAFPKKEFLIKE